MLAGALFFVVVSQKRAVKEPNFAFCVNVTTAINLLCLC